jgi:hypothetical protein
VDDQSWWLYRPQSSSFIRLTEDPELSLWVLILSPLLPSTPASPLPRILLPHRPRPRPDGQISSDLSGRLQSRRSRFVHGCVARRRCLDKMNQPIPLARRQARNQREQIVSGQRLSHESSLSGHMGASQGAIRRVWFGMGRGLRAPPRGGCQRAALEWDRFRKSPLLPARISAVRVS